MAAISAAEVGWYSVSAKLKASAKFHYIVVDCLCHNTHHQHLDVSNTIQMQTAQSLDHGSASAILYVAAHSAPAALMVPITSPMRQASKAAARAGDNTASQPTRAPGRGLIQPEHGKTALRL